VSHPLRSELTGFVELRLYAPRQKLFDAVDRVLSDAIENMAQVPFRVEVANFCRADE
jgi:hypothetical protein